MRAYKKATDTGQLNEEWSLSLLLFAPDEGIAPLYTFLLGG